LQLYGNTTGLSPSERKDLLRIYRRRVPWDVLTTAELSRSLAAVSHATMRQVGALVHRSGQVVIVGDASKLMLPDIGRLRGGFGRFRGLRLIHTHLRSEPLSKDDLVDLTRLRLDLVAALCLSPEGNPITVYYAHCIPVPQGSNTEPFQCYGPIPYGNLDCNPSALILGLEEEFARTAQTRVVAREGSAILIHVNSKNRFSQAEDALRELRDLARTAGVEVADTVVQIRDHIDPKTILGRGKLNNTVLRAMQLDAGLLIFDCNLSPSQAAAIAAITDLKVIDRSQLILDIFAQRAESRDGKLQVELAQMRYLLPRLGLRDDSLSRLTGGIGGRGPGETKLEIGKRRARERISRLETQLKQFARQRRQRRARRTRRSIPVVAIVGYTNVGKSTLLNSLTNSEALTEDKLFATLDTRSRRIRFPREREVVITDTVGFIRDLPDALFNAFRATFEEAADADLLLHVVDVSDPAKAEQIATTESLLQKLGIEHINRLIVFNKSDLLPKGFATRIAAAHDAIAVSAKDPQTLFPLLKRIEEILFVDPSPVVDQRRDAFL
jgi:GTP-binding protein HflX